MLLTLAQTEWYWGGKAKYWLKGKAPEKPTKKMEEIFTKPNFLTL